MALLLSKTALDKESVVKATPFYQAVMRLDTGQQERASAMNAAGGGGGDSARSAGPRVSGHGRRPKAILMKASLTSVLFELVRSDPWETVMRAGMSGLVASLSSNEGGVSENMKPQSCWPPS